MNYWGKDPIMLSLRSPIIRDFFDINNLVFVIECLFGQMKSLT